MPTQLVRGPYVTLGSEQQTQRTSTMLIDASYYHVRLTDGGSASAAALEPLLDVTLSPSAALSRAQYSRIRAPFDVGQHDVKVSSCARHL